MNEVMQGELLARETTASVAVTELEQPVLADGEHDQLADVSERERAAFDDIVSDIDQIPAEVKFKVERTGVRKVSGKTDDGGISKPEPA